MNRLVLLMDKNCVFCEAEVEFFFLYKIQMNVSFQRINKIMPLELCFLFSILPIYL